ncbi:MAG: polymerase subunit sigma-24 [Flavipsychrobacter sp.]|nr:polymerase subunit sigma-24 [Flavipsychrobacter sp.]
MDTIQKNNAAELPDEELIGLILADEPRLYEIVMRRYNSMLYRIGMSIVNNETEVEDIMQVTYIKAYENLRSFERRSSFSTWLTRILINESLYQLKKSKRNMMSTDMNSEASEHGRPGNTATNTPVHTLLNKELGRVLEQALVQLPEKYRLVFVLREMENRSIAETGDTLNISETNVKVRLNRAKTMLRDTLGSYYKNDSVFHFHLTRCDRIVNNVFRHLGIVTTD